MFRTLILAAALLVPLKAMADNQTMTAGMVRVDELKAVFATVESANIAQARARIPGTIKTISVDEGDMVKAGQAIARIEDDKLVIQLRALDAGLRSLDARLEQARREKDRAVQLREKGTIAQARLDDAATALDMTMAQLDAAKAERAMVAQQMAEGTVEAPRNGRVTAVHAVPGSVVMPGEAISTIAEDDFILRLALPERHANALHEGTKVFVGNEEDASGETRRLGRVRQVYPEMTNGQVVADVTIDNIGDFFVGQRARIWVSVGHRMALLIPPAYLSTRFGLDYVKVRARDGSFRDTVVQIGQPLAFPDGKPGVEILSGLIPGDVIATP
ncbi:MAG TPA: efflux RND transporter periplasmic adaptor subunit [Rhodospirillaceae bacterium]|nr:MAG: hypothetical protein A2018_02840 [Alphaproteobacteria bacterium GWF2_58_20]HAU29416.1 efflux RND transporter periplasmic adaptor subunit [Rhodospirillaceae bacterium]